MSNTEDESNVGRARKRVLRLRDQTDFEKSITSRTKENFVESLWLSADSGQTGRVHLDCIDCPHDTGYDREAFVSTKHFISRFL